MRHLEWEDLRVKVDGRYLHHLRFADDIVLITPNIEQAERSENAQEDDVVDEGFIPVKASVNGEDVKEKAVKNELLDSGNK
uniref:Reverse transcriptase domain-containing protein n=1 Tax=Haemonchus contortus TaxID=6289 RepID=A0A7I4YB51_HAECO